MKTFTTVKEIKEAVRAAKAAGKTIGLVPTMGALHEGHLSLIRRAREENDLVVVSVFVNPIQFNNKEDLAKYPRTVEADCEKLASVGTDFAFVPTVEEMYPEPVTDVYHFGPLEEVMEGPQRPGHFSGVAVVVRRLFDIAEPDRAYFGEKDYQQLFLIERMVKDLNFDIEIHRVPIVRESTGLAMSSRNEYLSVDERKQALAISRGLNEAKEAYLAGERGVSKLRDIVVKSIVLSRGQVQFVEIVNQNDLQKYSGVLKPTDKVVVLVAAFFGKTRLIDNIEFN